MENEKILNLDSESMDDFKEEISHSMKRVQLEDMLKGTVIGVSDKGVTVDLGIYAEGIIPINEYSNDPTFSVMTEVTKGQDIEAVVTRLDDGNGSILLSKKKADDILAWNTLRDLLENRTVFNFKIIEAVNAGVIGYLEGIRAFIPASQLSLSYVEDLTTWAGKMVEAIVITADENNRKLVLSAKEVEKEKALANKNSKISKLQKGIVTNGTVEKITAYGAFVSIGDGISGLVHISEMSFKRIKTPKEVVSEGQEIQVKILDIKDGKVSLSMKAIMDKEEVTEDVSDETLAAYTSKEGVSTGLGDLLAKFRL